MELFNDWIFPGPFKKAHKRETYEQFSTVFPSTDKQYFVGGDEEGVFYKFDVFFFF